MRVPTVAHTRGLPCTLQLLRVGARVYRLQRYLRTCRRPGEGASDQWEMGRTSCHRCVHGSDITVNGDLTACIGTFGSSDFIHSLLGGESLCTKFAATHILIIAAITEATDHIVRFSATATVNR